MPASQFLIIAVLIFVNGFFVAAEFALVKVRASQIDQLAEKGNWAAKLTSRRSIISTLIFPLRNWESPWPVSPSGSRSTT